MEGRPPKVVVLVQTIPVSFVRGIILRKYGLLATNKRLPAVLTCTLCSLEPTWLVRLGWKIVLRKGSRTDHSSRFFYDELSLD